MYVQQYAISERPNVACLKISTAKPVQIPVDNALMSAEIWPICSNESSLSEQGLNCFHYYILI